MGKGRGYWYNMSYENILKTITVKLTKKMNKYKKNLEKLE